MAIRDYNGEDGTGIAKDFSVHGNNTYHDADGQGCGTIWFKSVPVARKALKANGVKNGSDFVDCTQCRCSHSVSESNYESFPEYLCREAKREYAKSFEK